MFLLLSRTGRLALFHDGGLEVRKFFLHLVDVVAVVAHVVVVAHVAVVAHVIRSPAQEGRVINRHHLRGGTRGGRGSVLSARNARR